jgi:hypothetical protein
MILMSPIQNSCIMSHLRARRGPCFAPPPLPPLSLVMPRPPGGGHARRAERCAAATRPAALVLPLPLKEAACSVGRCALHLKRAGQVRSGVLLVLGQTLQKSEAMRVTMGMY